jgi:hypothetical protein
MPVTIGYQPARAGMSVALGPVGPFRAVPEGLDGGVPHRVRGMVHVQHARVPPGLAGPFQVGGPVGELDAGAAGVERAPDRGAGLAVVGELVPDVLEAVGPLNSAPSDPATRLASDAGPSLPRKAASAPKGPGSRRR